MTMPIFLELTEGPEGLHCDFCYKKESQDKLWTFPCDDFVVVAIRDDGRKEAVLNSSGHWAACDQCAELVTSGDHDALLNHIFNADPMYGDQVARLGLVAMVEGYFKHRTGPGEPPWPPRYI